MNLRPVRTAALLASGSLLLAAAASGQTPPVEPSPPSIGVIEVSSREVFDARGGGLFAPHRIANRLHVRTRDHIIRRELLFETGDPLDRELIDQTERNLRGLWFLRDARVETAEVDEDGDGRPPSAWTSW